MFFLTTSLLFLFSGFFMKLSDDEYDENKNKPLAILFGLVCGILIGILTSTNINASYIFFGILIGNFIAFKVDGIHHIVTLIAFLTITFSLGFGELNLLTLMICTVAAYVDELGNDNEIIAKKSKFLETFFEYRFFMKIIILILSLFGLYQSMTGFNFEFIQFLSSEAIILFLIFEMGYEIANIIHKNYLK